MSLLNTLLGDPPPSWAFEVSEAGIAWGRTAAPGELDFRPLPEGAISVSPLRDNVQQPEVFAREVAALAPAEPRRNQRAALILPDYCARTAVLDFDSFPSGHEEQLALVRFRMKKAVPFDLASAIVSYHPQPTASGEKRIDVVVALIPSEIVSRYEAPFREVGFQPGEVTTSTLAALNMVTPGGITMLAKIAGATLSVLAMKGGVIKLARCVELERVSAEEVLGVLHPTVAFIEDELKAVPNRLVLCGFGLRGDQESGAWASELSMDVEPLRSRFGVPAPHNAGLMGYMEAIAA